MIDRKIAVVFALAFLANLGYGVMLPSLSLYALALGASHSFIGLIVSAFAAAQLMTQIPMGRLADRIGRKYLVASGFGGVGVAAALHNFAASPAHFFFLQGLAGIAFGCVWPPLMALLTDDSSAAQRGKLMGAFNTIFFIGMGAGPLLGGYIASSYGYVATFNLWAAIAVFSGVFSLIALRETAGRRAGSRATASRSQVRVPGLLKPGFRRTFIAGCAIRARGGFCTSFNNALLPLYAVALFGASTKMFGSLLFIHGLMLAIFNLPGGMVSDRFGRRMPAFWGSLIATVGVVWYSFPSDFSTLLVAVGLAGAGSGFATPAVAALTADVCNPERRGEAFGYFLTSFYVGMVFGALIFGFVSDLVGLPGAVLAWGITSLLLSLTGWIIREAGVRAPLETLPQESRARSSI